MLASDVRYRFVIDTASLRAAGSVGDAGQRPPGGEFGGDALDVLGPASWWVTSLMNAAISSASIVVGEAVDSR